MTGLLLLNNTLREGEGIMSNKIKPMAVTPFEGLRQPYESTLSIELSKVSYSEMVVRKALYWCSPFGEWTLHFNEQNWVINIGNPSASFEAELHRHLNDFILREKLDKKTAYLRDEIITAALKAVKRHVSAN